jgi:hypothetical protein
MLLAVGLNLRSYFRWLCSSCEQQERVPPQRGFCHPELSYVELAPHVSCHCFLRLGDTVAILILIVQDLTSFDNFTNFTGGQQLMRNFACGSGEGGFYIPLDLNNTDISGIQDGANVTLQYLYNGGDGSLYEESLRVASVAQYF